MLCPQTSVLRVRNILTQALCCTTSSSTPLSEHQPAIFPLAAEFSKTSVGKSSRLVERVKWRRLATNYNGLELAIGTDTACHATLGLHPHRYAYRSTR